MAHNEIDSVHKIPQGEQEDIGNKTTQAAFTNPKYKCRAVRKQQFHNEPYTYTPCIITSNTLQNA